MSLALELGKIELKTIKTIEELYFAYETYKKEREKEIKA